MDHASATAELQDDISRLRHVTFVVRGRPGLNDRPALPPGHPVTWEAITNGTMLAEAAYPFPVFAATSAR